MADAPKTFQIKVTLQGIRPPIWRRLVLSGGMPLDALHRVLQIAMGWENSHLHCFRIDGVRYGLANEEDFEVDEVDERTVTVAQAFGDVRQGFYDYDFADSWHHELVIEKRDPIAILFPVPSARADDGRARQKTAAGPPVMTSSSRHCRTRSAKRMRGISSGRAKTTTRRTSTSRS